MSDAHPIPFGLCRCRMDSLKSKVKISLHLTGHILVKCRLICSGYNFSYSEIEGAGMQNKIPVVSKCGNPKCGNTFTTKTHREYPDGDVPENKKLHVHFNGPSYSVLCARCGCFTLFSVNKPL